MTFARSMGAARRGTSHCRHGRAAPSPRPQPLPGGIIGREDGATRNEANRPGQGDGSVKQLGTAVNTAIACDRHRPSPSLDCLDPRPEGGLVIGDARYLREKGIPHRAITVREDDT